MKILGIDPGSVLLGYGAIDCRGNSIQLIEYGVVKAKLIQEEYLKRLEEIHLRVGEIIDRVQPDIVSFESMFYHKNVQTLIKLAQARAVAILAVTSRKIDIIEYSPMEVKKSVTGKGNASKQQVQFMVRNILKISETPEFYDSTDALAIAITHSFKQSSTTQNAKRIRNWNDFVNQNPDRVIK
ncbi:MAG: crossover junction endodeoxyribonuclease RuvC [Candidatus Kapaibacteriota bacterium]